MPFIFSYKGGFGEVNLPESEKLITSLSWEPVERTFSEMSDSPLLRTSWQAQMHFISQRHGWVMGYLNNDLKQYGAEFYLRLDFF